MTTTITTTIKSEHAEKMELLKGFADGTYDVNTLEAVSFADGYQVTFCQVGDNYSDDEYFFLCAMFTELSSDGKIYCGVFDNSPEISFHFSDYKMAVLMAKKFNQVSVWNWKACDEIKTGGPGKR